MTNQQKWTVLIPPPTAGGVAQDHGPFDTQEEAWQFVERLPTEQGLRARVIHDQPPK
jgi:hypothetical protein